MQTLSRTFSTAVCVALAAVVAGCGGGRVESPTGPSGFAGATITGTVNGGNPVSAMTSALAGPTAAAAPSGMTVTIVGTTLSAPVDILGQFEIAGVPPGSVQLRFQDATVNAVAHLSNVGQEELIQIRVNISGSTATIVSEQRSSGKISLCHRTDSGSYHLIEVSVSAEPAHRGHGDGKIGETVPADPTKTFGQDCRLVGAAVSIEKSTNGEDADDVPGPTITVGSPVTWRYVVTNTGSVDLTNVLVVDNRNVAVNCGGQSTLAVGQSMTCTGSGVATLGQYSNVGTVTANWTGGTVTDSDASHYLGVAPDQEEDGPKVQLCHKTGNGSYHLIEVSVSAEPAHRAHGDGKIGEAVPGSVPPKVFGAGCVVR